MSEKILLIDGHIILNRAYYGLPNLTNWEGLHTNAVYGFLNIMTKVLEEEKPEYLAVAFDLHAPTFRHKMYDAYKGTRKPMPEELREQVPLIKEVLTAMGVATVNEKVMIGRIDQQIRVNKLMIDYLGEQKGLSKHLRKYMISYLTIIMTVSSVMMMRSGTEENLEKKNDLWRYLKQEDAADYFRIRHGIFGTVMSSKSKPGQKIAVYAYKVAQKLYGFN